MKARFTVLGMLILLVSVIQFAQAGSCPKDCWCSNKEVDCSANMEFPLSLPANTVRVRMSQLNVLTIPPKAFSYLPNISIIEITNGNIGYIQGCAFQGLTNIKKIKIDKCAIGNIERYAFYGISGIEKLTFEQCRIGKILPFAFMDVSGIDELFLHKVNILNTYSQAFYNVSEINHIRFHRNNISDFVTDAFVNLNEVNTFEITDTSFWNLHCDVMMSIFNSSNVFIFHHNTFYCNCSVAWLLNDVSRVSYADVLKNSLCHGPSPLTNRTMFDVKFSDLQCRGSVPSDKPEKCYIEHLVPRPKCPTPGAAPASRTGEYEKEDKKDKDDGNSGTKITPCLLLLLICLSCQLARHFK